MAGNPLPGLAIFAGTGASFAGEAGSAKAGRNFAPGPRHGSVRPRETCPESDPGALVL
jgi:hypothetical protein